jgi:hypothetical protein
MCRVPQRWNPYSVLCWIDLTSWAHWTPSETALSETMLLEMPKYNLELIVAFIEPTVVFAAWW